MIYSNEPDTWQDLQQKVAEVLSVCGCESYVEHEINLVRGQVEMDVVAFDRTRQPEIVYLCECKYWRTPIPQSVVHSFRTIVNDFGAHFGFIISRVGFQSGAHEAAKKTNISLVNWYDFQALFSDRWVAGRYEQIRPELEKLFEYYDYLSAPIRNSIQGNEDRMKEYGQILDRYKSQANINPWNRMIGSNNFPPPLPVIIQDDTSEGLGTERQFKDYSSFFDWHEERTKEGLERFQGFVDRYKTGPVGT